MLMLPQAFRVSEFSALQLIVSLTKISPLVPVVPTRLVDVAVADVEVSIVILLLASKVPIAIPVISPPVAAIVKSTGSTNQLPVKPRGATVVILTPSANLTCAALVSINPPLPPLGADASKMPPTRIRLFAIPPISII